MKRKKNEKENENEKERVKLFLEKKKLKINNENNIKLINEKKILIEQKRNCYRNFIQTNNDFQNQKINFFLFKNFISFLNENIFLFQKYFQHNELFENFNNNPNILPNFNICYLKEEIFQKLYSHISKTLIIHNNNIILNLKSYYISQQFLNIKLASSLLKENFKNFLLLTKVYSYLIPFQQHQNGFSHNQIMPIFLIHKNFHFYLNEFCFEQKKEEIKNENENECKSTLKINENMELHVYFMLPFSSLITFQFLKNNFQISSDQGKKFMKIFFGQFFYRFIFGVSF